MPRVNLRSAKKFTAEFHGKRKLRESSLSEDDSVTIEKTTRLIDTKLVEKNGIQNFLEKIEGNKLSKDIDKETKEKTVKWADMNIGKFEWKNYGDRMKGNNYQCIYYSSNDLDGKKKIAGFDIDWTIIKTKSEKKFPVNYNDWKLFSSNVIPKLKELHDDNFRIVFFTNQGGIETGKQQTNLLKKKFEEIVKKIGLEIPIYCCGESKSIYRKPSTKIFDLFLEKSNKKMEIDLEKSFYCGDAAGRPKDWKKGKSKDFSCSDRKFAANLKIEFYTPEEFFDDEKIYKKFEWNSYDPWKGLKEKKDLMKKEYHSKDLEMIILVGMPACGKTTFVKEYLLPFYYSHINRDTLKTAKKCLEEAEKNLKMKKSVVIDNTSPSISTRSLYLDLAKKYKCKCRSFYFDVPINVTNHLNSLRQLQTNGDVKKISSVAYNVFKSKYEKPTINEGFNEVLSIPWFPHFPTEKEKQQFLQWTE
ncbi:hypothetical protein SNEBB_006061 [Seison nebaliae]|nr:hypothetical protein SNEBB_006061 [Seison nebaliae]